MQTALKSEEWLVADGYDEGALKRLDSVLRAVGGSGQGADWGRKIFLNGRSWVQVVFWRFQRRHTVDCGSWVRAISCIK
ncbi:hypothetical protein LPB72_11155 [Hydrogenophaga crassostreae]|uniref:Uncharacterized protein n=1 Tax=Hydrogenophaga crassostreae TaxID=1763535 RepID=A0A167HX56_9BURK|nr:hypothetical protein LPB072_12535 [Hydrogenophaga crassostreae]OAD41849.1 hypothetical protein LPB72_11155 [Hydrogenophaga crassostreae]